ncbi:MAG: hypothetical protein WD824_24070 [Cyclobacteriaceae bacterium]
MLTASVVTEKCCHVLARQKLFKETTEKEKEASLAAASFKILILLIYCDTAL